MTTLLNQTLRIFLLVHVIFSLNLLAHEKLQTNDHREVLQKVLQFEGISKGKNLVVFDIDNTLLASNSILGSDQWFEWQAKLITNNETQFKIANSIEDLLAITAKIKALSTHRLTQEDLPMIIQTLRMYKIPVILLTSRGPELRDNTEASLKENKIWMSDLSFNKGLIGRFIPTGSKVEASFMNGIFMTNGMHKGEALKYILKYSNKNFEHIIFVDDHVRHTDRVFDSFATQATPDITTYRYGREDNNVATFKNSDKTMITSQFQKLKNVTEQIFGQKF